MSKLFLVIVLASTAIWSVPESSVDTVLDTRAGVSECELAEEWVAANLDALPKTLAAFGEHSVTFRRAIYGALDTEARVSLWRQNLVAVADGAAISPEQRLYLEELSGMLDGYLRWGSHFARAASLSGGTVGNARWLPTRLDAPFRA